MDTLLLLVSFLSVVALAFLVVALLGMIVLGFGIASISHRNSRRRG